MTVRTTVLIIELHLLKVLRYLHSERGTIVMIRA